MARKIGSTEASQLGGPLYGITRNNFPAKAIEYIKANRNGAGVVIRKRPGKIDEPATPELWSAWISYLASKDIRRAAMLSHGVATVPCERPEDFDAEYSQEYSYAKRR